MVMEVVKAVVIDKKNGLTLRRSNVYRDYVSGRWCCTHSFVLALSAPSGTTSTDRSYFITFYSTSFASDAPGSNFRCTDSLLEVATEYTLNDLPQTPLLTEVANMHPLTSFHGLDSVIPFLGSFDESLTCFLAF